MLLKAPHIVTMEGEPLKDHAILVEGEKIARIAPQKDFDFSGGCLELPHMVLLPGLINAHCHLELSQLPEPLPYPGSFVLWIDQLTRLKLQMRPEQVETGIQSGIQKLIGGGTTTVCDHISPATPLEPLLDSPLEGICYLEVLGLEKTRAGHFYNQALAIKKAGPSTSLRVNGKFKITPTPHATYSLLPEVFAKLVSQEPPLSVHIAESAEEYLLFKEGSGPLFEFLRLKGEAPTTVGETPLQYLKRLSLLPRRGLAVHANYLEDEDAAILREAEMSVVHCPGSHAYFEHARFPLGLLQEAGIPIALGTDSLASNESLSILRQMQIAMDHYAELTPEAVLKMGTANGARAILQEGEIGSLKGGKRANIIGVPFRFPKQGVYENILLNEKVPFSMIRGEVVWGF